MRKLRILILGLILALALLLRLKCLGWGFPDFLEDSLSIKFLQDIWGVFSGKINFKPHRYDWSPFYYYLMFFFQYCLYLGGRLSGYYTSVTDVRLNFIIAPTFLYYTGRLLTVFFALGAIGILYSLGQLFFPKRVALLGVLFFSLDPLFLRYSQTLQTDIALVFFTLLATYFLVKIYQQGKLSHYILTGIAIGLGAATKYTPIIFLLPALVAHYLRVKGTPENGLSAKVAWLLCLPLVVFALVNPYSVLDFATFSVWIDFQTYRLQHGHFTNFSAWLFPGISLQKWWTHLLVLGSALYFIFREKKERAIVFLCPPLWYYLFTIKNTTYFDYYLLPIFPFFYLLLANLFVAFAAWAKKFLALNRPQAGQAIILLLTISLFLLPLLKLDYVYLKGKEQKSTYTLTREWLEKNIGRGTIIVSEVPPPQVQNYQLLPNYLRSAAFEKVVPRLAAGLAKRPTYYLHGLRINILDPTDNEDIYSLDNYRLFSYLIINTQQAIRYKQKPALYPVHNKFYADVARDFVEVARFRAPQDEYPEIIIYKNPRPFLTTSTPLASLTTYNEVLKKYRQNLDLINSYLTRYGIAANYL